MAVSITIIILCNALVCWLAWYLLNPIHERLTTKILLLEKRIQDDIPPILSVLRLEVSALKASTASLPETTQTIEQNFLLLQNNIESIKARLAALEKLNAIILQTEKVERLQANIIGIERQLIQLKNKNDFIKKGRK